MNVPTVLQPVSAGERIEAMDVLRGFALLGILLMNIEAMAGPLMEGITGLDPTLTGADRVVDAAIYILVQGKFYLLFSMLFGMGFAVMMQRAGAAGRPFERLYLRRTIGLLGFGLVHTLLVWSGDVLVAYALMSIPLVLLFRHTPQSRLPKWGVALYVAPLLAMFALGLLFEAAQMSPQGRAAITQVMAQQEADFARTIAAQREAYGSGGFLDATRQRALDSLQMLGFLVVFGLHILGMFVLGSWFVRSGAIARPEEHRRLFARLRWVALPMGLVLMLASFQLYPGMSHGAAGVRPMAAYALHGLASLLMALGYLAWIVRGLQAAAMRRPLGLLAPAGRMALTNYLLQSLVCTLVFYGYGLGYFDRMPRAWQPVFVFALFGAQVVLSHWWLSRHAHGPMERLWRAWTYRGQSRTIEAVPGTP